MKLPRNLYPLRNRSYRLYFFGQAISLIGTWMTSAATLWLAYRLTGTTFYVGVAGFANLIPSFLLGPFAGVWVDRVNRLKLFTWCQVILMVQSLALAALAFSGVIHIWHILLLNVLQGVVNAFDATVRQAMVRDFVESKEDLGTAIALNSSNYNLARLVGPALAGIVLAAFGPGYCFLIDGLSYIAVIVCVGAIQLTVRERVTPLRHPLHELREGISAAFGFAPIRALILLIAVMSFAANCYTVLTPELAADVYGGTARTLGWLMAAVGLGAFSGAVWLGSRTGTKGLGVVITWGCATLGTSLILLAFSHWLVLALISLCAVGVGLVLLFASANTLIQSMIQDDLRGRVLSIYTMAYTGAAPLGNLLTGTLTAHLGPFTTLTINGGICLLATFLFWRELPRLRILAEPRLNSHPFLAVPE